MTQHLKGNIEVEIVFEILTFSFLWLLLLIALRFVVFVTRRCEFDRCYDVSNQSCQGAHRN